MFESLIMRARRLLEHGAGIASGGRQPHAIARRLEAEAARLGLAALDELLASAESGNPAATEALQGLLTVKYSRMWREPAHWPILAEHLRLRMATGEPVRLWSAACAHGEEAFTAAIVAARTASELGGVERDWRILATDIDAEALRIARTGRIPDAALDGLPAALRERYMKRATSRFGVEWEVSADLLDRIDFAAFDLTRPDWPTPRGTPFDAIFLCNVLIYLDRPTRNRILTNAASLLRPDGIILTARAEGGIDSAGGRLKACGPCAYILSPRRPRPLNERQEG